MGLECSRCTVLYTAFVGLQKSVQALSDVLTMQDIQDVECRARPSICRTWNLASASLEQGKQENFRKEVLAFI